MWIFNGNENSDLRRLWPFNEFLRQATAIPPNYNGPRERPHAAVAQITVWDRAKGGSC